MSTYRTAAPKVPDSETAPRLAAAQKRLDAARTSLERVRSSGADDVEAMKVLSDARSEFRSAKEAHAQWLQLASD